MALPASIKWNLLEEAKPPELEILPDNRLRLTRFINAGDGNQVTEEMFDAWGTPDVSAADLVLVPPQELQDLRIEDAQQRISHRNVLVRRYEGLPAFPQEMAAPEPADIPDCFVDITAVATTGSMTSGLPTLTVLTPGFLSNFVLGATVAVAGAVVTATVLAVDVTGRILTLSANATATVTGAAVTGSYTRPAREFTSRLIVAGLANAPAFAVAKSAPYYATVPSGQRQRYFTGERVEQVGTVFGIITRTYAELPSDRSYTKQITLTIPGLITNNGSSDGGVFIYPPVTRLVNVTVNERFSLVSTPTALGYNPPSWAMLTESITPDATGDLQYWATPYDGYLASDAGTTYTGSSYRGNIIGTGYTIGAANTPIVFGSSTYYPASALVIASTPEPWKGDLWRITDVTNSDWN